MIGYLSGAVVAQRIRSEAIAEVTIDVAGVGYRVMVDLKNLRSLEVGSLVSLFIHTNVKEDAIVLYGFESAANRDTFEALLSAHGVGPAVALAILSVFGTTELQRVIATKDVDALTIVPGIGKKTAARLLIELESKLGTDVIDISAIESFGPSDLGDSNKLAEVKQALAALGYSLEEIRSAVSVLQTSESVEDMLKAALTQMVVAQ